MLNKILVGFSCFLLSGFLSAKQPGADILPNELFPIVELQTTAGKIKVELDRMRAPITVNNFLYYVKNNSYDGTIFHRVEKDFVIQGGGYDAAYKERDRIAPIFNESGNGLKNEMFTFFYIIHVQDRPFKGPYISIKKNIGQFFDKID